MSLPVNFVPPAFSAVFVSTGTLPVSSILTPAPSDGYPDDAFARADENSAPSQLSLRLIGADEPPRIELAALRKRLDFARGARRSGDLETALEHYRASLSVLESPFDAAADSAPLHRHLPDGRALFRESLFETSVLSAPEDAPAMLNRLSRFIGWIEGTEGCSSDIAQAKILKAYKIMQHTMSASQPKGALLKEAYNLVQGVRYDLDSDENSEIGLYAGLLSIELLARSIAMAHNRRDFRERNLLIERQREIIKEVLADHLTDERREAIASYISDSALLLARLGLWSPALERARTVTSRRLVSTSGAKRLLANPLFDPFVDGARILSAAEIKFRTSKGSFMRRFQAALALAHSKGLRESIFAGLFGLVAGWATGLGASALLGTGGETALVASIAGAALFATLNRIRNGWNTLEARYAAETGTFDRTAAETAHDASQLVLWGGINAATWLLPAAILNSGTESASVFAETLSKATGIYKDLSLTAADGIISFTNQSIARLGSLSATDVGYSAYQAFIAISAALAASSLLNKDVRKSLGRLSLLFVPGASLFAVEAAEFIADQAINLSMSHMYDLYIKASAAFFLANFFSPISRSHLSKLAPLFLPGAFGLSAEIGMHLLGQDPGPHPERFSNPLYLDRIARASIISGEMMFMQFITGLMPLRHGASVKEALGSAFYSFKNPHAYMPPITAAIIGAGIMSPLGGMMQEGMDVHGFSNHLIQGVAITLGILPLGLGISGMLKRFIPITSRLKEAWEDTRGLPLPRALLETLMGYQNSFTVPYMKNRLLRAFTMDLPAAALRATVGWDTNPGQLIMSSMNLVSGTAMATSTWPEASATAWERRAAIDYKIGFLASDIENADSLQQAGRITAAEAAAQRAEAMATTLDFFANAGQVTHFLHPFMAHKSLSDRLWPLYAVSRSFKPPTYPRMPNVDFYANLQRMLSHSGDDELSAEGMEALLKFVEHYAKDPENYELLRPLIKTLALSRNSTRHGGRIEGFFRDNPWITDVLNIDPEKYRPSDDRTRRIARSKVKRRIRKRFDKYEQRVASHGRQAELKKQFEGLFLADGELLGSAGR
jgi:hypothetical protein